MACIQMDQLIEKAFNVNAWMNRNLDNEWVQNCGQTIITGPQIGPH